jgi:hypothetical protein
MPDGSYTPEEAIPHEPPSEVKNPQEIQAALSGLFEGHSIDSAVAHNLSRLPDLWQDIDAQLPGKYPEAYAAGTPPERIFAGMTESGRYYEVHRALSDDPTAGVEVFSTDLNSESPEVSHIHPVNVRSGEASESLPAYLDVYLVNLQEHQYPHDPAPRFIHINATSDADPSWRIDDPPFLKVNRSDGRHREKFQDAKTIQERTGIGVNNLRTAEYMVPPLES